MQTLRQVGGGILVALVSGGLVLGSLSAGLAEGNITQPRPTITETALPASEAPQPLPTQTPADPSQPPSPTVPPSPTATEPAPISCLPPAGWRQYNVHAGDTVAALAQRYNISSQSLLQANCLQSDALIANTFIFVPPFPTQTPIPCGPPFGWIMYTVQSGDNLFRLSLAYRVDVVMLQSANCLGTSVNIIAGEKIYVPNVPTSTPVSSNTPSPTVSPTQTATLPNIATLTPTFTPTSPSETASPQPSNTPTPQPTLTPTPVTPTP